jgi:hypothetical protein
MGQTVIVGALFLLALGSPLAVLTAIGAHRRGDGLAVSVVAGLAYPITWVAWYLRDEHL